jgi:hypothetical protein
VVRLDLPYSITCSDEMIKAGEASVHGKIDTNVHFILKDDIFFLPAYNSSHRNKLHSKKMLKIFRGSFFNNCYYRFILFDVLFNFMFFPWLCFSSFSRQLDSCGTFRLLDISILISHFTNMTALPISPNNTFHFAAWY